MSSETSSFALGPVRMDVRAPAAVAAALGRALPEVPPGEGPASFSVEVAPVDGSTHRWRFVLPDTTVEAGALTVDDVAHSLLTQFTRLTVVAHPASLFVHAGVVAGPSGAVVAMAPSGTGKSTLTARLVQAGHRYLSDEVAWMEPGTWIVTPFPRPLGLDGTSLGLLGHPERGAAPAAAPGGTAQWWLDPADLGDPAPAPTGTSASLLVVLVRGRADLPGPVHVLADADKAVAVLANQLNLLGHADPLGLVCSLLGDVPAVGVAVDDLDAAAEAVRTVGHDATPAVLSARADVGAPDAPSTGPMHAPIGPFGVPDAAEPLSVATFSDGSAVVLGARSGRYAVTNEGGARLVTALGHGRPVIDLAAACDVAVPDAEAYFTRLGQANLVGSKEAA